MTNVGLSIYGNAHREGIVKKHFKELETFENFESRITEYEDVRKKIVNWASQMIKDGKIGEVSAELNSLSKMENINNSNIILISSDTFPCYLCSKILSDICQKEFDAKTEIKVIDGLQTRDSKLFREKGVRNYLKIISEYSSMLSKEELRLNVTGGFKALLPISTTIANILGHEAVYIFERSDELITIPPLPISIDVELWGKYAHILKEISEKGSIKVLNFYTNQDEKYFAPFFERCDSGFRLSYLGDLFYDKYKSKKKELLRREKGRIVSVSTGGHHSTMWGGDEIRGFDDIPVKDAKKVLLKIMEYPIVSQILLGSFDGNSGQAYEKHFVEMEKPELGKGIIHAKMRGKGKKHNWMNMVIYVQKGMELEFYNSFPDGVIR